jgi:hypothetical protein
MEMRRGEAEPPKKISRAQRISESLSIVSKPE